MHSQTQRGGALLWALDVYACWCSECEF